MRNVWIAFTLVLTGCVTGAASSDKWERYTVDLSGRKISFSAPPGTFSHVYVPQVDLATNKKQELTLFDRSWVFSGLIGDAGALQLNLALISAPIGATDLDMLRAIQQVVSSEVLKVSSEPVTLSNVAQRRLGNAEWLCYGMGMLGSECSLRVDARHYIAWRMRGIDNLAHEIGARDRLATKIEASVEVDF